MRLCLGPCHLSQLFKLNLGTLEVGNVRSHPGEKAGIVTERLSPGVYPPDLSGGRYGPVEIVILVPPTPGLAKGFQGALPVIGMHQVDEVSNIIPEYLNAPTENAFE